MLVSLLLRYVPSRLHARTWRLGSLREGGREGEEGESEGGREGESMTGVCNSKSIEEERKIGRAGRRNEWEERRERETGVHHVSGHVKTHVMY